MSQIIINGQPLYQVDLPEMTMAEYLALPVAERPKEWIRTDAEYTDIPAENVELSDGTSVADRLAPNKTLIAPKFGGSGFLDRNFYTTDYKTYFELHFCIDVTGSTQPQNKALFDLPDFAKGKVYQYGVGVASALGTAHGVVNAGDYIILSNAINSAIDNYLIGTFRMSLA